MRTKFILIFVWLLFTVSLVIWWIIFGSQQIERLAQLDFNQAKDLVRYQKMLFYEGTTMILCLLVGGGALFYYLYNQIKEANRLKVFFATFTHEIKTPLAGALLKLEMLEEANPAPTLQNEICEIKSDLERLTMQIENSLFLSDDSAEKLFLKEINLAEFFSRIAKLGWSGINRIDVIGSANIKADERILETIVRNLLANSAKHGKATTITITITPTISGAKIDFLDNGQGFVGDQAQLTKLFTRHYSGSGSGIGLYLVSKLVTKLDGRLSFPKVKNGFLVRLEF